MDDEDYTVRAVGRVTPGETIRVDVSAPEGEEYGVYLYNRNLRIEDTDSMSGSGRATFSSDALEPGSYLAAVYDGGIVDVYPVVVEGYELTTNAPATADGEFDATVTVADGALTREPHRVQVVLGDDERSVRADATRVADGEYRATLSTEGFDPGTYALYGVVRGEDETEGGDRVILAIGDRREVRLETPTPTAAQSDGGGGGGGQLGQGDAGEVEVRAAELLNETVRTGEDAVVRVDLANFDPYRGTVDLALAADGDVVAERSVAVGASTERTVSLRTTFESPGTYDLALDGEPVGSLVVEAASTATPTPTGTWTRSATPTASPAATVEPVVTPRPTTAAPSPQTTGGDGPGFGAVVAALAVALVGVGRALGRPR